MINLSSLSATFDEETGDVTLSFLNAPGEDDPNPVIFQPDRRVGVTIPGGAITLLDGSPLPEPELEVEPEPEPDPAPVAEDELEEITEL